MLTEESVVWDYAIIFRLQTEKRGRNIPNCLQSVDNELFTV